MKTATGGRIEWSRPLIIREIEIGWSSSSNRIRVYYPGPGHGNNTPTKSSIPTPPGTVYFLESVNRSDALKIIDKLSTIGTVRSVVIKTRYTVRSRHGTKVQSDIESTEMRWMFFTPSGHEASRQHHKG